MARRSKEDLEAIRDANSKMREWNMMLELGEVTQLPQEVQLYRNKLKELYENAGKNVKDDTLFSPYVKFTPEQNEEFMFLAIGFADNNDLDIDVYEGFLEDPKKTDLRNRQKIKNLDDVVEFIDRMNNYKNSDLLKTILSSEQVLELDRIAASRKISSDNWEKMAIEKYNDPKSGGITGKKMFEYMRKELRKTRTTTRTRKKRNRR